MIGIKQLYIVKAFVIFLISSFSAFAGSALYLKNYTKQEYQAANQNWSVTQDGNGYMYFANNIGLLEFDGITWTLYPAPEGAIIRAVAVDGNNRVFTAGYRELGYWERNELGRLNYHSLKQEIEQYFTTNEEFWNVIVLGDQVYFQSFSKVFPTGSTRRFYQFHFKWWRPDFCQHYEQRYLPDYRQSVDPISY